MTATVWITYAWADNQHGDIDYIAQVLESSGLNVKLDRWNIGGGKRLWDQVDAFISKSDESNAWVLVATQESLQSEACKEEYAYALDRTLNARGASFPVIALFPESTDEALIPAGLKTRLHVSLIDANWKEKIVAAAEGRDLSIPRVTVKPYALTVHRDPGKVIIEVRPRAGIWSSVFAAVPFDERETSKPWINVEPAGSHSGSGTIIPMGEGKSSDGAWWWIAIQAQATPRQSLYISMPTLPKQLRFGGWSQGPEFTISLPL